MDEEGTDECFADGSIEVEGVSEDAIDGTSEMDGLTNGVPEGFMDDQGANECFADGSIEVGSLPQCWSTPSSCTTCTTSQPKFYHC